MKGVNRQLADKAWDLGVQVCTVLFDSVFLAAWLLLEYCLEHYLVPRYRVETQVFTYAFLACRILFAVATVIPILINIVADVQVIWFRSRARVADVRDFAPDGPSPEVE